MAAIIGRQDPRQHPRVRMVWMKSEPFRGGECLDQIMPDLSAAPIVVPSREMQIGFRRQLDSASDELEEVFARMGITRRHEVACSGKETGGVVEEILPPPACRGAARRRGRMTGRGGRRSLLPVASPARWRWRAHQAASRSPVSTNTASWLYSGRKLSRKSAALLACDAARTMARLSSRGTSAHEPM